MQHDRSQSLQTVVTLGFAHHRTGDRGFRAVLATRIDRRDNDLRNSRAHPDNDTTGRQSHQRRISPVRMHNDPRLCATTESHGCFQA